MNLRKVVLLGFVLLVACQSSIEQGAPEVVKLDDQPPPRVHLQAHQTLQVALDANLSAGYIWTVVDVGSLRLVKQVVGAAPETTPGAGAIQIFTFVGAKKGKGNLVLAYGRPWQQAVKTVTYQISVTGAHARPLAIEAATTDPPKPSVPLSAYPDQFDWRTLGGVTPVKDQGACGSCWAFATIGVVESAVKINAGREYDLSEQHLVSCNTQDWGCQGGMVAFNYYLNRQDETGATGTVLEADFPYQAQNVPCGSNYERQYWIQDWQSPGDDAINTIKRLVYEYGPVAVTLCVGTEFANYTGGNFYYDEWGCFLPWFGNHAVTLVGWDDADAVWIVKNSWGAEWGESGYMRIGYGTSHVGFFTGYITFEGGIDMWHQTIYRGDVGYYRQAPVVRGTPLWSLATDWQSFSIGSLPGSGTVTGQSDVIVR